jgi:hypothetical protein
MKQFKRRFKAIKGINRDPVTVRFHLIQLQTLTGSERVSVLPIGGEAQSRLLEELVTPRPLIQTEVTAIGLMKTHQFKALLTDLATPII